MSINDIESFIYSPPPGAINDLRYENLRSEGYYGSLNDMLYQKFRQKALNLVFDRLFINGEQGINKLDFSDFTGMYQDRARTIPYTAVEQPLGSFTGLNGTTATAPADVNRGVVSARVNLLSRTSPGTIWGAATQTEIPGYFGADVGFSLLQDGVFFGDSPYLSSTAAHPAGQKLTSSALVDMSTVWPGASAVVWILGFQVGGGVGYAQAVLPPSGVVGFGPSTSVTEVEVASTVLYGSVYHISVTAKFTAALTGTRIYCEAANGKTAVWGRPQITYASDAHLPYQRVNTATDYDTAGFPHYLAFNGTNTAYVTPSIDFTGTDKMTVWAGVTSPMSATGVLLGIPSNTYNAMTLYVSSGDLTKVLLGNAGNSSGAAIYVGFNGHGVISASGDFGAPQARLRVNSSSDVVNTSPTGGGTYQNCPITIGGTNGLFFNGRLYSLIVRGTQSSLSQIEAVENLIRQKMRLP